MQGTDSLVKYRNPELISTDATKDLSLTKKSLPPVQEKTPQTEDILNSILPPRYVSTLLKFSFKQFKSINFVENTKFYKEFYNSTI